MSRRDRIAQVITDHSFDYDERECMCGYRDPCGPFLALHVAAQIEEVLES